MDWLKEAGSILNSPTFSNLAGNLLGGNKKPSPPPPVAAPVIQVQNPVASSSMSTSTMLMIGAGLIAVVGVMFLAFRK